MKTSPSRPLVQISNLGHANFAATCGEFTAHGYGLNSTAREAAALFYSDELGRKVTVRDVAVSPNADGGDDLVACHVPLVLIKTPPTTAKTRALQRYMAANGGAL